MSRPARTFWVLPAVVVGLSGCGTAKGDSASSDLPPPRPLLEVERQQQAPTEAPLLADPLGYKLGAVPIHGGDVEMLFQVRNESAEPLSLTRVTASCGCTIAVLVFADGSEKGPFGMPGHDLLTEIERTVEPGEEFQVRVTFDPAAHGLAGLGKVERAIFLHTAGGGVTQLIFDAEIVIE